MGIEAALYIKLAGDSGVAALVGSRIYPLHLPQAPTLPALVYERISTVRTYGHDGQHSPTTVRMQVDSLAPTLAVARSCADAVLAALSGFSGTVGSLDVRSCFADNEINLPDEETGLVRVIQDFLITFMEV